MSHKKAKRERKEQKLPDAWLWKILTARNIVANINSMHKKRGDEMHQIYPDTIEDGKEGKGQ